MNAFRVLEDPEYKPITIYDTVCPRCRSRVQIPLSPDDKIYQAEAEYRKKRYRDLGERYQRDMAFWTPPYNDTIMSLLYKDFRQTRIRFGVACKRVYGGIERVVSFALYPFSSNRRAEA